MATFTRKHFQAVADVLCHSGASEKVIAAFSEYFKGEAPRFQRPRFERAVASCKRSSGLGRSRRRKRR